jgi:predicted dehydrogenase
MNENRRGFLRTAALTALSRNRILGANDRIRVGGIGTGLRGTYVLGLVKEAQNTEIVAVCDAYAPRMAAAKQKLASGAHEHADFRELLGRKDIDAVVIGTPDHWHVPMIMAAVEAGKDVYVEKPVSHTIAEGERLLAFMGSAKQVVQVGYQQRSWNHFQHAREVVASGKLGKISLILTSWYQDYLNLLSKVPEVDRAALDWKAFLGSAPDQPYDPLRFARWRWFWDFGGGHLTDLFSHLLDVVHWYNGAGFAAVGDGDGRAQRASAVRVPGHDRGGLRISGRVQRRLYRHAGGIVRRREYRDPRQRGDDETESRRIPSVPGARDCFRKDAVP